MTHGVRRPGRIGILILWASCALGAGISGLGDRSGVVGIARLRVIVIHLDRLDFAATIFELDLAGHVRFLSRRRLGVCTPDVAQVAR